MSGSQWSCDKCTFKQSARNAKCEVCNAQNPFFVGGGGGGGSGSGGRGGLIQQQFQAYDAFKPSKIKVKPQSKYMHWSKPRTDGKKIGSIVYQVDRISKVQVANTFAIYELNKNLKTSSWPIYVFGDNDIDVNRLPNTGRDMIGGLAGVLGDYDQTDVSFGVMTTFYARKPIPSLIKFGEIIDIQFRVLRDKYIMNGHNIIVPSPNMQDLHGMYTENYWGKDENGEKVQTIKHNIGTGLARIPYSYIKYIQTKFDELDALSHSETKKKSNDNNN